MLRESKQEEADLKVVSCTSFDSESPPENILSKYHLSFANILHFRRNKDDFWMSTGLYPQELIIKFENPRRITYAKIVSQNVKEIELHVSSGSKPNKWDRLSQMEMQNSPEGLQVEPILSSDPGVPLNCMKLVICSGYDDCCTIHNFEVQLA